MLVGKVLLFSGETQHSMGDLWRYMRIIVFVSSSTIRCYGYHNVPALGQLMSTWTRTGYGALVMGVNK